MKNLFILLLLIIVLASCHNYKKEVQILQAEKDSLISEGAMRDSSILNFLEGYNEILANFDSIKKIEQLVTVQSNNGRELSASQKVLILEDIQLINDLLQKNKDQISKLQGRYKSSNYKVGKLENMVDEFELMLENIKVQNLEKDDEIYELNDRIQELNKNVIRLTQQVNEVETESIKKDQTIDEQTNLLNQVFYVFGSTKELKNVGIIDKKGGFLGIGKTSVIKTEFNQDYFTLVDIRDFDYLPLLVKKAKLLSVHPTSSYHITGEKSADTLFIDDKHEFWKATKYLIISTN